MAVMIAPVWHSPPCSCGPLAPATRRYAIPRLAALYSDQRKPWEKEWIRTVL